MSKNVQKIVTFPSNPADMQTLEIIAEIEDRTISWLIRDAIKKYNEVYFGEDKSKKLTFEELEELEEYFK